MQAGRHWLLTIADSWLKSTGQPVPLLDELHVRTEQLDAKLAGMRSAGRDVDDAELALLDHDLPAAERLLAVEEQRLHSERRRENLDRQLTRFRANVGEGHQTSIIAVEELLATGQLDAAARRLGEEEAALRQREAGELQDTLCTVLAEMSELAAPPGMLAEVQAAIDEIDAHPDRRQDPSRLDRAQDALRQQRTRRVAEAEEDLGLARRVLAADSATIPPEDFSMLEVRLADIEAELASGRVMRTC